VNALIHIFLGGDCARCEKPAIKVIGRLAYCSDECEERISDYGLDDAVQAQHVYTDEPGFFLLLKGVRAKGYRFLMTEYEIGPAKGQTTLYCVLSHDDADERYRGEGNNLPAALAAAVLKLIDAEEGKSK
jgi:hypothetical protein